MSGSYVLIDIKPYVEDGNGDTYYFRRKGEKYVNLYLIEDWSNHNSSGQDVYDLEGNSITDFDDDPEFEEFVEEARDLWASAYAKHVTPALGNAVREVISIIN